MIYVALLRGINVGGKNKVAMSELKTIFQKLGHTDILTYINSGNIVFANTSTDKHSLAQIIENELEKHFGFFTPVVVKSKSDIQTIMKALPDDWVNDGDTKTDVMFLWDEVNDKKTLDRLTIKPGIDNVKFVDGAILWMVARKDVTKSGLLRIIGMDLYRKMTIRNANTLRKISDLVTR